MAIEAPSEGARFVHHVEGTRSMILAIFRGSSYGFESIRQWREYMHKVNHVGTNSLTIKS